MKTKILFTCQGKGLGMAEKQAFDPQTFLDKDGAGRTVVAYQKLGFIDYNGDLRVHSSLLNVVLHD